MSAAALSFKNSADFLKFLKDEAVQFVAFNFTDLRGQWHHCSQHASSVSKDLLDNGIYFDGSSIAGWQGINQSDMSLRPDLQTVCWDPFAAQKTIKIFSTVHDPRTNKPYDLCPRQTALKAEQALKKTGIADTACFGPEIEFFVFDDVRFYNAPHHTGFEVDCEEGPYNAGRCYDTGKMGHRPGYKAGYFREAPVDSLSDLRGEMLTVMETMGMSVEKHHHEVAPSQCEIGFSYGALTRTADNVQLYKHAVRNVAHSYGRTATFMPKPLHGENGSGMHCHVSLWKGGKNLFAGKGFAGLSDNALYFIGGVLKHARALNAFTNPATNSYKRLVPGYEAPVILAYGADNRSAACRIPQVVSEHGRRAELRFPDPAANPYLTFAAVLMAGLDGIENKIHPGDPADKDLYNVTEEEASTLPHLCRSLREALAALETGRSFLLKDDVFSEALLDSYIRLKREEVERLESTTQPVEYAMYYSS